MNADKQVSASFGEPNGPVLSLDGNGTIHKPTGAATISGTLSCSDGSVQITVLLRQQQTSKGRTPTTTTVTGSGSTTAACGTAWEVTVNPTDPAGSKFAGGAAAATVSAPDASTVTQTVQLK
jgi:hypothetical protein